MAYHINMHITSTTFAVNYVGRPFTTPLLQNKPLAGTLAALFFVVRASPPPDTLSRCSSKMDPTRLVAVHVNERKLTEKVGYHVFELPSLLFTHWSLFTC